MRFRSSCYALLAFGLLPLVGHAAENWGNLKLGMSVEETLAALGQPLMRTSGRGFETWTYDKGGDVLIFGSLIGWTAPASARMAVRSKDIWSENRSLTYLTALSLVPRRFPPSPRRGNVGAGYAPAFYPDFYRR